MIDVKCKYCNEKVVLKVEHVGVLEDELIKHLLEAPCSNCVPPNDYLKYLLDKKPTKAN
jgi:hypothetical protein